MAIFGNYVRFLGCNLNNLPLLLDCQGFQTVSTDYINWISVVASILYCGWGQSEWPKSSQVRSMTQRERGLYLCTCILAHSSCWCLTPITRLLQKGHPFTIPLPSKLAPHFLRVQRTCLLVAPDCWNHRTQEPLTEKAAEEFEDAVWVNGRLGMKKSVPWGNLPSFFDP